MFFLSEDQETDQQKQKILKKKAVKYHVELGKTSGRLLNFMNNFAILIFHTTLNVLIIYDTKDVLSMILFIVEMITIPLHLLTYMKRKKTDSNFYLNVYSIFKPVFACCLSFCFVRYLTFFLRYSVIQYYTDKFFFAVNNDVSGLDVQKTQRNWIYYAFFSSKDNTES
jgi:hypothetical protein